MPSNTLVLTGTIAPSQKVLGKKQKQLNALTREKEYFDALFFYINESDFDTIIFCDNSNHDFQYKNILLKFAEDKGKIIEFLKFSGNPIYPEKYGYGAGEQEILDYIYENSQYIKRNKSWIKLSGRYIVYNINDSIKKLEGQDIYFQKYGIRGRQLQVSTLFFKVSNDFFGEYLYKNVINLFIDIFESKTFELKKFTKYPYVSVEYLYYYILRNYLINHYKTKAYVSNHYKGHSPIHYFLYDLGVKTGICDFTLYNKMQDKLLFKKTYNEIIKIYSEKELN